MPIILALVGAVFHKIGKERELADQVIDGALTKENVDINSVIDGLQLGTPSEDDKIRIAKLRAIRDEVNNGA